MILANFLNFFFTADFEKDVILSSIGKILLTAENVEDWMHSESCQLDVVLSPVLDFQAALSYSLIFFFRGFSESNNSVQDNVFNDG